MRSLAELCRNHAKPLRVATATGLVLCLLSHSHLPIHVLSGSVFTVAAGGHVLGRTRWIRTVSRRIRGGLPRRVAIDGALAVAMVTLAGLAAVSGVVSLLDPAGGVGEAHGVVCVVLTVLVVVHALRHRHRHRRTAPEPRSRGERGTRQPAIRGDHVN